MTRQQRRYEARKGIRVPSFTAMSNKRVDAIYARTMILLGGNRDEAMRYVARQLPRETKRSWAIKPSKSDDPKYRKVAL